MTRQEAADALDEIGLGVVGDDLMDGATPTELIRDLDYHWGHSDQDEDAREAFAFAEKVLVALRREEHLATSLGEPRVEFVATTELEVGDVVYPRYLSSGTSEPATITGPPEIGRRMGFDVYRFPATAGDRSGFIELGATGGVHLARKSGMATRRATERDEDRLVISAVARRIVERASALVGQPGPYAPMGIMAAISRAMDEVEDEDDQVGQYKEDAALASDAVYWAQTRHLGTRGQPYWPAEDETGRRVGRAEMEERERQILSAAADHLAGLI